MDKEYQRRREKLLKRIIPLTAPKGYGTKRLKILAELSHGKVLDIGFAGDPNPFLKNATGFDICKISKPKNYKEVYFGDAHELTKTLPKKTFDTIIAGDIIEHLENPAKFLSECHKVLKDKGVLLISTPNAAFIPLFFLNILMIKKYYFNDTHINLFLPRIFYKLLRYCDFKLIKIIGTGMYIPGTKLTLPLPTMLSQHLIYIAKKASGGI